MLFAEPVSAPVSPELALPAISSFPLKFAASAAIVTGLMLVGGCDRQSKQATQPQAPAEAQGEAGPAAGGGELAGKIDRSHRGAQMPELVFKAPDGKELRLTSLKGRPVLLSMWATWCAPCVAELPKLDALAAREGGGLKVLTVSEDLGDPARVATFLKDKGLARLEPWLDPDNAATMQYQISTLPETIYYDAGGREVWRLAGGHDWSSAETGKLLAEAGGG